MKIFNKLRAILNIAGEQLVLNLKSAEFRKGRAFLHLENGNENTYVINNCSADLLINNGEMISYEDVFIKTKVPVEKENIEKPPSTNLTTPIDEKPPQFDDLNFSIETIRPKAKITFTMFADERDLINRIIKDSGYNRTDYFIACFQNNLKKSVSKSFISECEKVKKIRSEYETK